MMRISNFNLNIAAVFFGFGLGFGFIPILIASLLLKENLFVVCISRMDGYWRGKSTAGQGG